MTIRTLAGGRGALAVLVAALSAGAGACDLSAHDPPPPGSYSVTTAQVSTGGAVEKVNVATVDSTFFQWPPAAMAYVGRAFVPEEFGLPKGAGHPVVILSHGFWEESLSLDPSTIGRSITVDGRGHTVVGILPPEAELPEEVQILVPVAAGG